MVDRAGSSALCLECVDALDVTGAGIMLMTEGTHHGTLGVSNPVMGVVEDLQFTLGEGPCIDASSTTRPVFEPDLGAADARRWPAFTGPALQAGVRAVFGFPLLSVAGGIGALDLYLDRPGSLSKPQEHDATFLATVIADTVLSMADAEPGQLDADLGAALDHRAVVHQASGMVAVQMAVDIGDALVRIRAHAYTSDLPVNEVARAIVARQLRLD